MLIDEDVDAEAERQHEHAGNLAQNARRERADRVVEPIDVAAPGETQPELRRHEQDEDRNGVDDDVQARLLAIRGIVDARGKSAKTSLRDKHASDSGRGLFISTQSAIQGALRSRRGRLGMIVSLAIADMDMPDKWATLAKAPGPHRSP